MWSARLLGVVSDAVIDQIAVRNTQWSTLKELEERSFRVAKAALGHVCPSIPVPRTSADVEALGLRESFYWRELWEHFYSTAYNKIIALGR